MFEFICRLINASQNGASFTQHSLLYAISEQSNYPLLIVFRHW